MKMMMIASCIRKHAAHCRPVDLLVAQKHIFYVSRFKKTRQIIPSQHHEPRHTFSGAREMTMFSLCRKCSTCWLAPGYQCTFP